MSLLLRVFVLLLALLPAACTRVGSRCNEEGFLCEDPQTALECREGVWVALPCRGLEGCTVQKAQVPCQQRPDGGTSEPATCTKESVFCDASRAMAGDACGSTVSGGLCSADGKALLECRDGTFIQTRSCSGCAESDGQVLCQD